MQTKSELARAKINLLLDVITRRPDGYHLIDGVMQSVTLADRVDVSFENAPETVVTLSAEGNDAMPTDMTNLACRAAKRYLERAGISGRVGIRIEKRIPMAAGLAGGSADAAAVLRALDALSGHPLGIAVLCDEGAKLGADVPFCIREGAMRTEGIGDKLTPCDGLRDCFLVIACAGEGVSTPWAYGQLDLLYHDFQPPRNSAKKVEKLLHALQIGDFSASCACFENIFESVVADRNPFVGEIKRILTGAGAVRAMMSGSGPSVFGVFREERTATVACERLAEVGIRGAVCQPVV